MWIALLISISISSAFAFGLDNLIERTESRDIQTVEGFLRSLPPVYKENFVGGYRSQAQGASSISSKFPRLIGFSPMEANFVATTSAAHGPRHNVVELIQWQPLRKQFLFTELDFSKAKVVNRDPTACFGCHRGHPIWDLYPAWPGFFGSAQVPAFQGSPSSLPIASEFKFWQEFITNGFLTDRVQSLNWSGLDVRNPFAAYREFEKRNTLMTRTINIANAKRLADFFEGVPNFYERFAPALLLLLAGYDKAWHFINLEEPKDWIEKKANEITRAQSRYFDRKRNQQLDFGIQNGDQGFLAPPFTLRLMGRLPERTALMMYFIEELFGLNALDFEISLTKEPTYVYSDGGNGFEHVWTEVTRRLLVKFPKWAKVFKLTALDESYAKFTRISYEYVEIVGEAPQYDNVLLLRDKIKISPQTESFIAHNFNSQEICNTLLLPLPPTPFTQD